MPEEKHCLNCGEAFIPTCHKTRQKYCSSECRYRYNNAKRNYGGKVNICPECGAAVEQREKGAGRWRRFCRDQCRVAYHDRKVLEKRRNRERAKQICPNCGKEYQAEWGPGSVRRFCSDACRVEWWAAYHKANPEGSAPAEECAFCGGSMEGKRWTGKYCSRFCCLLAMDQRHEEVVCEWCGEKFTDKSGQGQRYCSRSCAVSARFTPKGIRRGSRRISAEEPEEWKEKLTEAARATGAGKRGKRVRLVCGTTSMYTGLDGLLAIIRYHLKRDPYDGSVYVFRDGSGTMLK